MEEELIEGKKKIELQQKELEGKTSEQFKAEQAVYEMGQKETTTSLTLQIRELGRDFCCQTWMEALNAAEVDSSSKLREPFEIMYPSALGGIVSSSTLELGPVEPVSQPLPKKERNDKGPKEKKDKTEEPKEKESIEQDFYNFI